MKTVVRRAIKDEKGAALALALILLVVGGLVLTPLLGLMSTGLISGQVYERKTDELYAADAGVEDAIWRIQDNNLTFVNNSSGPWHLAVNGRNVTVEVHRKDLDPSTCGENLTYRILSIAATDEGGGTAAIGSSTTVEAYIEPLVFDLFAGALVSKSDIWLKKDAMVTGDIYYATEIRIDGNFTHNDGNITQVDSDLFPTQAQTEAFAQTLKDEALVGGTHPGDLTIDSDATLGPRCINGNLNINKDVTLLLTGTIYVEGTIDADKDCAITGTGSIVAVYDIYLAKLPDYGVEGDTIIMSVNGAITFKKEANIEAVIYAPNGAITMDKDMTVVGSVVGASIQADKDGSFTYVPKGSSFGFFAPVTYGAKIKTYIINP